ncbi:MAG: glycerophosphodiester phosphodiesterase [Planctomycetota bacterium]
MGTLHPKLIAHRGWTECAVENSFEAIAIAVRHGARGIEFDVRRTADLGWVLNHDRDLERLHGVAKSIEKLSTREVRRAAGLPRLAEVLALFHPGCLPMVEVKEPESLGADELAAELRPFVERFPVVVIVRSQELEEALYSLLPTAQLYLYTRLWDQAEKRANPRLKGFDLPGDAIPAATRRARIAALHQRGQVVAVWTINDAAECQDWIASGADYVITDVPARVSPLLT